MPVPTLFSQLSTTAASNDPASSEARTTADDYFRQIHSFLRQLYEGATNGQIAFPATQNASSNANTLDDYEEGSWTPTDGSGAALTFATAAGRYVKVGKVVHYWARVQYPATADASSSVISGLPFTAANPASLLYFAGAMSTPISSTVASGVVIPVNTTSVYVYRNASRSTNADLTGASLYFSGSYEAAA